MLRLKLILFLSVLGVLVSGCSNNDTQQDKTVFKQIPELREIRPEKPVKIKLKRSVTGKYSWDLKGDAADKVLEVNRKLKANLDGNVAD